MADMKFTVIDTKTGKYPDLEKIAHENWADGLMWCDMDGFMIGENGELILADECGNYRSCPADRFDVKFADMDTGIISSNEREIMARLMFRAFDKLDFPFGMAKDVFIEIGDFLLANGVKAPAYITDKREDRSITENTPQEPAKATESTLKDSGSRREFDTGAVRDIAEGKGRCDLMPLDVVSEILGSISEPDAVLIQIADFMETGDETYLYHAIEYFRNAWGVPTETILLELAKHFEEGAKKYGEYNWQKGIPVHCYIDSAVRHYLKWQRGDKDEPHDRAFVWNLICCIWTIENKPELNDLHRKGGDK